MVVEWPNDQKQNQTLPYRKGLGCKDRLEFAFVFEHFGPVFD